MGVYIWNRLPSEYQEVEYIGRNGNNYIDTGWIPKQATTPFEVRIGYKISTAGVRYGILSNYDGTSSMGSIALEINSGTDTSNKARFFIQSYGIDVLSSNSINTSSFNDIIFKNNTGGSLEISVNGTNTTASTITETSNYMYSAYLFIDRGLRWSTFSNNSFISYCKIYESGTLVRDFIPCYRKSDSVIGLYDLVNNQFYTNSGSGTFSKGSDVNTYRESSLKNAYIGEYVWNGDLSKASTSTKKQFSNKLSTNSTGYSVNISQDGTKVLLAQSRQSNGAISEFSLSTPFDITTASLVDRKYFSREYIEFAISKDGTKVFSRTASSGTTIEKYTLSNPFSVSGTWTKNTTYTFGGTNPAPFDISEDGKTFVVNGNSNAKVYQTKSNTAWSLSTTEAEVFSGTGLMDGKFSRYGDYFYLVSNGTNINRYKLGTAWDLTTATLDQTFSTGLTNVGGICFDKYGNNMYVTNTPSSSDGTVYIVQFPLI